MNQYEWIDAALNNEIDIVYEGIEQGIDINGYDANGKTALMQAAEANNTSMVKLLIEAGADHQLLSEEHQSAFTLAATQGHKEAILTFIELNAIPEPPIDNKTTFLDEKLTSAIFNKRKKEIVRLLELGARHDRDSSSPSKTCEIITKLICENDLDTARAIMKYSDKDYQEAIRNTITSALADEIKNNMDLERIESLLAMGANPNARISFNDTIFCDSSINDASIICLAIHYHRPDVAEALVKAGGDINTPLTAKAIKDSDTPINTPLAIALLKQNIDSIKFCLNSGAKLPCKLAKLRKKHAIDQQYTIFYSRSPLEMAFTLRSDEDNIFESIYDNSHNQYDNKEIWSWLTEHSNNLVTHTKHIISRDGAPDFKSETGQEIIKTIIRQIDSETELRATDSHEFACMIFDLSPKEFLKHVTPNTILRATELGLGGLLQRFSDHGLDFNIKTARGWSLASYFSKRAKGLEYQEEDATTTFLALASSNMHDDELKKIYSKCEQYSWYPDLIAAIENRMASDVVQKHTPSKHQDDFTL